MGEQSLTVVALCADWCRTCGEFHEAFDRLAREFPAARFEWLDIEDDAAILGDLDVENFPTLAIYRGPSLVHFGISLPQEGVVRRLLEAFTDGVPAVLDQPEDALTLPSRIATLKTR